MAAGGAERSRLQQAIQLKAEIMVDHFHEQVLALNKIGGNARAMVVTSGIQRAIQYYHAIRQYLVERKSPYQAIVAFSGEHEYGGAQVSEASLNGFPSGRIADEIQHDPYRFLICADKFQTGYDEPLHPRAAGKQGDRIAAPDRGFSSFVRRAPGRPLRQPWPAPVRRPSKGLGRGL